MPARFLPVPDLFFRHSGLFLGYSQLCGRQYGQHRTRLRPARTMMVRRLFTRDMQMDMNNFFTDLQGKINQAIESSPAKDIEKNVKAMMTQGFSKLDLVTREEFDIQAQVLAKTRAKLDALEQRIADLEAGTDAKP